MAQFVQDEARDDDVAGDESGGAYIGDAPVDDGARIQQHLRPMAVLIGIRHGGHRPAREHALQVETAQLRHTHKHKARDERHDDRQQVADRGAEHD